MTCLAQIRVGQQLPQMIGYLIKMDTAPYAFNLGSPQILADKGDMMQYINPTRV